MCRCNTIVAFSLKTISFSMKTYPCKRGLNLVCVSYVDYDYDQTSEKQCLISEHSSQFSILIDRDEDIKIDCVNPVRPRMGLVEI